MYGRLHWEEPSQTITSGFGSMGQGRYVHPSEKRTITPHEAARIQGFPDFFSFESVKSRGELHTMIANAVPPKIMATITNELIQQGIL
jgi:DNA (cytosine-5)-methyltransferase 1